MSDACYSCEQNAKVGALPARESILVDPSWRVAHAFDSALPGWLVVVPMRHVEALDELSEAEVEPLGPMLRRCSAALRAVTGAPKTYLMLFAEAEGFAHLHIHVVPRMPDFASEQKGPGVFEFLGRPESEWVPDEERDRIAIALRAAMAG